MLFEFFTKILIGLLLFLACVRMNCIRQSVLRHIRLRASAGTCAFGAENGSVMKQLTRLMCTSMTHSPDQIVDRVVRLVKKFDKIDASKVVNDLFRSFFS